MARALQVVEDDWRWVKFRPKLAKWLCLCECFPYRMSFLVLIITDLVQKELVNRLRRNHPSYKNGSYKLVHYRRGKASNAADNLESPDSAPADADKSLELPDDMPIVEAYFRHVERYIYSHPNARKMLSLDGDSVRARGTQGPARKGRRCAACLSIDG